MVLMVGYCNDGWIVVLAVVIRKIFFLFVSMFGGMCVVGIGGGVNEGCGGPSLVQHQQ